MNTKETTDIFKQLHKQWLHNDITKSLLAILDRHESSIVGRIATSSMDLEKSDEYVRLLAAQLSTTQNIKKLIHETETFVAKSDSR
jgi:predicted component of viral defense system (DUF524 family)